MSDATIGSELGKRRLALGLEKGQAADRIGMSRTTYSSYERDTQRPSVDVFPALANFLGVSMDDFLVLYGATCIAVVRDSLDRALANDNVLAIQQTSPVDLQHPVIEPALGTSVEADHRIEEPSHFSEQPDLAQPDISVTIGADSARGADELPYFTRASPVVEVPEPPEVVIDIEWPRTQEVDSSMVFGAVEAPNIYDFLETRTSARAVSDVSVVSENLDVSNALKNPDYLDSSQNVVDPVIRESPLIDFRVKSSKSKKKKKKGRSGKK